MWMGLFRVMHHIKMIIRLLPAVLQLTFTSLFWFNRQKCRCFASVSLHLSSRQQTKYPKMSNFSLNLREWFQMFCAVNSVYFCVFIYQTGKVDPHTPRVSGHKGNVLDVKWNPFSDYCIASCSEDTTVRTRRAHFLNFHRFVIIFPGIRACSSREIILLPSPV